jgi:hypothetical protein
MIYIFWLNMDSESLVGELQGYTVEKLKELCSKCGIKFTGRSKEELISLLLERWQENPLELNYR